MDVAKLGDDIVNIFKEALKILTNNSTYREREQWIKICKVNIKLLNDALNLDLPVSSSRKIHTNIGHLKRYKEILMNIGIRVGGGKKTRSSRIKWEDIQSAFSNRLRTGIIINLKHKDIPSFFDDAFFLFKNRIARMLKTYFIMKVNTCFCGDFLKHAHDVVITEFKYFNTKNAIIDSGTDLKKWFKEHVTDVIFNKIESFQERDSGWTMSKVISLEVNINKVEMGNGASSFVPLPKKISLKKACINIKNNDEACFAWSVTAFLHPADKNSDRTSSYPHYSSVLNLNDIEFPLTIPQISKFENNNNLSVNVFTLEHNDSIVPVRISKKKIDGRHVNLLMIRENTDNDKWHYVWIKNLSRLVGKQLNNSNRKRFICERCLNYFTTKEKLAQHLVYCEHMNECKISFSPEKHITFKNFKYKEKSPFVIYSDFESLLLPFEENTRIKKIATSRYQKHEAYSVGYYFQCDYNKNLSFYNSYRGINPVHWFTQELKKIAKFVNEKILDIHPMEITDNDIINNDICHICEKKFEDTDIIVNDHNHFTSKFRGRSHSACNLNYKKSFVVPIFFHNLSGYDSHFIIKDLAKEGNVKLLPINKEKYISFTQYDHETNIQFRFVDSFKFMSFSLEDLVSFMEQDKFNNMRKEFINFNENQFKLLCKKGVFPYDYVDSLKKLEKTSLPTKENFFSKLYNRGISDNDYNHAQIIWKIFNIKNLGEYSDLYLKTDVILLSDVFENFRNMCHSIYGLDPAHYYTLPGFSWDCMMKYTKCSLETIQDVDILLFFERGIRGGISQCSNRYAEANNKYLPNFNPSEPTKYLIYFDINNMYGKSMTNHLPTGGFKWVKDINNFDCFQIPDDSPKGYVLEVDLEYPEHLHDLHKDLPLAPEHRIPPHSKKPKLMTTLFRKEKYILHYVNLKQYLSLGLILSKIHRVLEFDQSPFLKTYIDLNSKLRAEATNKFGVETFKLLINAIFGKTMENVRKYRTVKLARSWEGRYGAKQYISSPKFHSRTIFDENLVAIELKQTENIFNKPLYIGMAVLDISKTFLYDFHYNYMLKKFTPEQCKLLYSDTDSLCYEVKCNDLYEEVIKADPHRFDTSEYDPNNDYGIELKNKKVIGLMKDENKGKIMTHFAGLRSKQYTFLVNGNKDSNESNTSSQKTCIKKSKGIKNYVVQEKITFDDYVECLRNNSVKYETQNCIISKNHEVYSIEQKKIALSASDDKRYILKDSTDTLPWGHYRIPK